MFHVIQGRFEIIKFKVVNSSDCCSIFLLHARLRVPSAPSFVLMGSMIPDAIVIAVVIFATNISLAKVFAKRNNYVIDSNQVCDIFRYSQSEK